MVRQCTVADIRAKAAMTKYPEERVALNILARTIETMGQSSDSKFVRIANELADRWEQGKIPTSLVPIPKPDNQ
jgi:hypothetical protein